MSEIEELEEKLKELKRKRKKSALPFERILPYFILIVCAPWLLYVVKNYGRDGWSFSLWDRWRFHWIPLTYVLYFSLGSLLFPVVEASLYIGFPILLAVGLAGLVPMSFPVLWVGLFLGVYLIMVYITNRAMADWRVRSRVRADKKDVLESEPK